MQTSDENGYNAKRFRILNELDQQIIKDKIEGMFLGVAIGDALGLPFESKSYEHMQTIKCVEDYLSCKRAARGSITDDTQLTIAVANALIEADGLNMDKIAEHHVAAYKQTTSGWGGTTRDAIKKISEGEHWSKSGDFQGNERRGFGNGVPMKISPVAAFFFLTRKYGSVHKFLVEFTAMTHQTSIAISSAFVHTTALYECLNAEPEKFDSKALVEKLIKVSESGKKYYPETLKDDLGDKLKSLSRIIEVPDLMFNMKYLVDEYGGGTCYVYNSLPFSYSFFLRSPRNIAAMYDAIRGGGDVDTNASIVGGMLGALNGVSIFPQKLIDGLKAKDEIIKLATTFYEKFALQPTKS